MGLSEHADLFVCIDHVGYAVADLDAAVRWHVEMLGAREEHREVNEEQGVAEAMLSVGPPTAGAARIQLLAPLRPDSAVGRFLARSGPGVQQVAYRVRDVEAVAATLTERGVRVLYPEPRRGTSGSRINFVHPGDTGGILVELVEPPAPEATQ